jgi:hypothetical protein
MAAVAFLWDIAAALLRRFFRDGDPIMLRIMNRSTIAAPDPPTVTGLMCVATTPRRCS